MKNFSLAERLRWFIEKYYGDNQKAFATAAGLAPPRITETLQGTFEPSKKRLLDYERAGVNPSWLQWDNGIPFADNEAGRALAAKYGTEYSQITPESETLDIDQTITTPQLLRLIADNMERQERQEQALREHDKRFDAVENKLNGVETKLDFVADAVSQIADTIMQPEEGRVKSNVTPGPPIEPLKGPYVSRFEHKGIAYNTPPSKLTEEQKRLGKKR